MTDHDASRPPAATIVLQLQPTNHLRNIGDATWEAMGNDPSFRCGLPDGGLEAGWYEVDAAMELLQGPDMWSYFYPDYGDPELERHKVYAPLRDVGGGWQKAASLTFPRFFHQLVALDRLLGFLVDILAMHAVAGASVEDVEGNTAGFRRAGIERNRKRQLADLHISLPRRAWRHSKHSLTQLRVNSFPQEVFQPSVRVGGSRRSCGGPALRRCGCGKSARMT